MKDQSIENTNQKQTYTLIRKLSEHMGISDDVLLRGGLKRSAAPYTIGGIREELDLIRLRYDLLNYRAQESDKEKQEWQEYCEEVIRKSEDYEQDDEERFLGGD
jgi:hypothetical protein